MAKPFIAAANQANTGSSTTGGYYFYDFNAKINHTFNDKNRLFLSAYTGKDKAYLNSKYKDSENESNSKGGLNWGNLTTALRWNHIINPKLFTNTTLTYSRYKFITGFSDESTYKDQNGDLISSNSSFEYTSGIYDLGGKIDFDYLPSPNHYIRFGINHLYHTFAPGVTSLQFQQGTTDSTTSLGQSNIYSHESALYVEDDIRFNKRLKANIGFHISSFIVKNTTYINPQPRISVNYSIAPNTSAKASYSKMIQYIHLLTNASVGLPTDLWVPVTDTIKPMIGDQYSIGLAHTLNKTYEITLEGYYKEMQNIIEYKDGVSFLLDAGDWQKKVESGKGWAYGSELFIQKKTGKFTGWIGYSLSWTNRQFEQINFGKVFPYKYDRRHDISVALLYDFSDKFNMGLTWEYGSGNALTLPVATYLMPTGMAYNDPNSFFQDNTTVNHFQSRNSFRTPAYHRMDISFNFVKKLKWAERTWNISIYNVYNRLNPFFLNFETETGSTKLIQYSLFPIIPSFSYNLKF